MQQQQTFIFTIKNQLYFQMTRLQDFVLIKKLGQGSFGTVYQVRRLTDQRIYAMKQVKINQLQSKAKNNALNEVRLLASLNHQNIITYHQAFFDYQSEKLCIIMQYADGGDLQAMIKKHSKTFKRIPQSQIWRMFILILEGIKALHQKSILHRDLKSQNIFLVGSGIKIGDLNVAKVKKDQLVQTQTGTPYYASPQIWNDIPYNQKSDIWSIGCIVYEMACLKLPFSGNNMELLYKNIQSGRYMPIPAFYSNQLSRVISKCLQVNPNKRSSAQQLLSNETVVMYKNIFNINVDKNTKQMTEASNQFLKTIFMPNNKKLLNERLPESNYQSKEIKNKKSTDLTPKSTQRTPKKLMKKQELQPYERIRKQILKLNQENNSKHIISQQINDQKKSSELTTQKPIENDYKKLQKQIDINPNISKIKQQHKIICIHSELTEKNITPSQKNINNSVNVQKGNELQFLFQFDVRSKINLTPQNQRQKQEEIYPVKKRKSLPRTQNSGKKKLERLSIQHTENSLLKNKQAIIPLQIKNQLNSIVMNKISAYSNENANILLEQFNVKYNHQQLNHKKQQKSRSNSKQTKNKSKQKIKNLNEKIRQSLKNLNSFQKKHKSIVDKATENIQKSVLKKRDMNYYRI